MKNVVMMTARTGFVANTPKCGTSKKPEPPKCPGCWRCRPDLAAAREAFRAGQAKARARNVMVRGLLDAGPSWLDRS